MLRVMMNVLRKDSAPHRKHIPFDKNVVKKSVTQELAASNWNCIVFFRKSASTSGVPAELRCGALLDVTQSLRDETRPHISPLLLLLLWLHCDLLASNTSTQLRRLLSTIIHNS